MYSGREINRPALMTDLYQLTMAAGYHVNQMEEEATFELFIRSLPKNRSYFVAAGLELVVEYLLSLCFDKEEIEWLRSVPSFRNVPDSFFAYLSGLRFTGDVWAVPEGTPVFENEPILQIRAPLVQAQLVETFLLSVVHFQTLIATKASRVVQSAQGRSVVDFGTRRAHGPEAGVLAARASFIGGCIGTSNVWAARAFQIPAVGTAAHSWTMAFPSEQEAFERYHELYPDSTVLLVDTYDTIRAVRTALRLGSGLKGVRLDSGDLITLSKEVRRILDEAGLTHTRIIASGDLNEYKIHRLVQAGSPIDLFGVGTEMVTSRDVPCLSAVYKLVERQEGDIIRYCAKFSDEKVTYPGRKQVWRKAGKDGVYVEDEIGTPEERPSDSFFPLLMRIIERGDLIYKIPSLDRVRDHASREIQRLPERCRGIGPGDPYPVRRSKALESRLEVLKQSEGVADRSG